MTIINGIEIDDINYVYNEIKGAINNNDLIEDKLHCIIVISNPCQYARRFILAKEFIKRFEDEQNAILYVVELAYGDQNFYITEQNNKTAEKGLKTKTSPVNGSRSKNLMITETSNKTRNVAVMTKEASQLNDDLKKNINPTTKKQEGIYRPYSK